MDGPLVQNIATPKGSATIFTETLAPGGAPWQGEEPRDALFYRYNDRASAYFYRPDRLPNDETLAALNDDRRIPFNTVYQAFGPTDNPNNEVPER